MFDHIEAFYRPESIPEAVRLIHNGRGRGRFVAGGTDVVVQADRSICFLVDITRLGLNYIRRKENAWVIGATTTMAEIEESLAMRALAGGILAEAAATCGSVQNRNMATVGGNLVNASPAADTATPLLALDAVALLAGPRSRRKVPLTALFSGPHRTVLDGALLVEVVIPPLPRGGRAGWSFQKLGRTESDISLVNVAAGIQTDSRGTIKFARIALGAVAPVPLRALSTEKLLAGHKLEEGLIDEVCGKITREVHPITDVRASAEYRTEMCQVLARRALRECAVRAGCPL
jgi:CO/xanthine dehydrogenase FAD-binding subunit